MKEITINGEVYVLKSDVQKRKFASQDGLQAVLIRSYASGVHFGLLKEEQDLLSGKQVTLINSRRIHYWVENASLSQIVQRGITDDSDNRISVTILEITITQVIEIIPLSEEIFHQMMNYREWKMN